MDWEDYMTNDTANGGACLTAADLEEQEERDALVAAVVEREQILEASRRVKAGTHMLFAALRKNGVIR